MKRQGALILFLLIVLFPLVGNGQAPERDFQTWAAASFDYNHKQRLKVGVDGGFRGLITVYDWDQIFVRPNFTYFFSQLIAVGGGISYHHTRNKDVANVDDLRLYEQFHVTWPSLYLFVVQHRFRFEQRLMFYADTKFRFEDDFSTRLRYRLNLETKDFKILDQKIYFSLGVEFFQARAGVIEPFVNNSRIFVGVGHRVHRNFRYEVSYINQRSRFIDSTGPETVADIFKVSLFFMNEWKEGS